ncbi:MAG: hypothetical protein EAZ09_05770 [Oscillatoriales cyanobacterium]|nr:MAG: hypothetical protein EAZ09_05770 [Oscillatoriales cyanobacterium]
MRDDRTLLDFILSDRPFITHINLKFRFFVHARTILNTPAKTRSAQSNSLNLGSGRATIVSRDENGRSESRG